MGHDQDDIVIANVLNHTQDDELRVIADQVRREVRSGRAVDEAVTEAQYTLGLSFGDAKRIEAFVSEAVAPPGREDQVRELKKKKDIDNPFAVAWDSLNKSKKKADLDSPEQIAKEAGLKSTLRKLRQQLNSHDGEDIEGMSKLITCIEGIEKQLDQKQKRRDERKKKRDSSPPTLADEAEGDAAEKEAAVDATAGPPPGDPPPAPGERPDPPSPQAPLPTGGEMVEHQIDLKGKLMKLAEKLKQVEEEQKKLLEIPEVMKKVIAEQPLLMEWLRSLPSKRALMERAGQKWSALLVEPEATLKYKDMLGALEERINEAATEGDKFADKLLKTLAAMKSSPKYQAETKPSIQVRPTPKDFALDPHMQAPSETPKTSGLNLRADMGRLFAPLVEGLNQAIDEIVSLVDIAETELQPA